MLLKKGNQCNISEVDIKIKYYIDCLSLTTPSISLDKEFYINLNDIYKLIGAKNYDDIFDKTFQLSFNNHDIGICFRKAPNNLTYFS